MASWKKEKKWTDSFLLPGENGGLNQYFIVSPGTCLLYGADGDSSRTWHNEVSIFDVWANFIQYKWNDVRFDGQEKNITFAYCLFVAGGEMDTEFLENKYKKINTKKITK